MLRRTTCKTVRGLLPLHVGGDLDPRRAGPVDEHLHACLSCFREYRELLMLRGRLGVLADQPLPPGILDGFTEEVMARVAVGEPGPRAELPGVPARVHQLARFAAAAVLLLALGLGLSSLNELRSRPAPLSPPMAQAPLAGSPAASGSVVSGPVVSGPVVSGDALTDGAQRLPASGIRSSARPVISRPFLPAFIVLPVGAGPVDAGAAGGQLDGRDSWPPVLHGVDPALLIPWGTGLVPEAGRQLRER